MTHLTRPGVLKVIILEGSKLELFCARVFKHGHFCLFFHGSGRLPGWERKPWRVRLCDAPTPESWASRACGAGENQINVWSGVVFVHSQGYPFRIQPADTVQFCYLLQKLNCCSAYSAKGQLPIFRMIYADPMHFSFL
jgi:hypothetical protein